MNPADDSGPNPVPELSPGDLADRLARGEQFGVLDVREDHERGYCVIKVGREIADLHLPLGQITTRVEQIRSLNSGGPLVVYCHHGVRSRMAAEWLSGQGIAGLLNLAGGIDAWSRVVDPAVPRY